MEGGKAFAELHGGSLLSKTRARASFLAVLLA